MNSIARKTGLAGVAIAFALGASACGSSDDTASSATTSASTPMTSSSTTSSAPTSEPMDTSMGTFGAACDKIPADGAGSLQGMASEPVATAASANPLLKTLVAAVTKAGLGDTLNSAKDITVFAPTDDAFAKIPKADLDKVLADKKTLTAILTHHVVPKKITPAELAGTFDTLNKDSITVKGSGDMFTVDNASPASIVCGNIQTANATVYVIDSVLMPK